MMKSAIWTGLMGASALALAACDPPHPQHGQGRHDDGGSTMKVISRLDCPDEQGSLTRKAAAADGQSCDYVGDDGAVVTLQLTALASSDADAVLAPLTQTLRAELPAAPPTPAAGSTAAAKTGDNDKVDINLPGVHIHADGDHAVVNAGNGFGHGGVQVDADDHGAEVHVEDKGGSAIRKIMILTSETPGPHGYQVVGYEARGPVGGPIVIASVKARDHDDHDDLLSDVRELLRRNVGG